MCLGWIHKVLLWVEELWAACGSKMNLCLISVFPSPFSSVGKALFTGDTTKTLSDISGIPVIFYLMRALFLDREGATLTRNENRPRLQPFNATQLWHVSTQAEL